MSEDPQAELTRLANHVTEERERGRSRDNLRRALREQALRQGAVIVSREVLHEAFPRPDQTENFFLAAAGCRPIPPLMEQVEAWCAVNGFEMRQTPAGNGWTQNVLIVSRVRFFNDDDKEWDEDDQNHSHRRNSDA